MKKMNIFMVIITTVLLVWNTVITVQFNEMKERLEVHEMMIDLQAQVNNSQELFNEETANTLLAIIDSILVLYP